jgi:hypothetical protein
MTEIDRIRECWDDHTCGDVFTSLAERASMIAALKPNDR